MTPPRSNDMLISAQRLFLFLISFLFVVLFLSACGGGGNSGGGSGGGGDAGGGSTQPNQAPKAKAASVSTDEGVAKEITLSGTDPDGNPLTYSIVSQPAHGILSPVSGDKVTYTPEAGYGGLDSFTFKVNDGNVDSASANVSIAMLITGKFIDSPVEGSEYQSDTQTGITGQNGIFKCVRGEAITFFVGKQPLGQATCDKTITVMDLEQTGASTNGQKYRIAQLLQSLDEDNNLANGITMTEENKRVFDSASALDFSLSDDKFLDALSTKLQEVNRQPVSLTSATNHVKDVLGALDYQCLIPPRTLSNPLLSNSSFDTSKMSCIQRAKLQAFVYNIQPEIWSYENVVNENIAVLTAKVNNEDEIIAKNKLLNFVKGSISYLDFESPYQDDNIKAMVSLSKAALFFSQVVDPDLQSADAAKLSEAVIDLFGSTASCKNVLKGYSGDKDACLKAVINLFKMVNPTLDVAVQEKNEKVKAAFEAFIGAVEAAHSFGDHDPVAGAGSLIKILASTVTIVADESNSTAKAWSEGLDAVGDALKGYSDCAAFVQPDLTKVIDPSKLKECADATVTKTIENFLKIGFRVHAVYSAGYYTDELNHWMLVEALMIEAYKYSEDVDALMAAWGISPPSCTLKVFCSDREDQFKLLIRKIATKSAINSPIDYIIGDILNDATVLSLKVDSLADSYLNGKWILVDPEVKKGTLDVSISVKTTTPDIQTVECFLSKNASITSGKVLVGIGNPSTLLLTLPSAGYHGIECFGYKVNNVVQGVQTMVVAPEVVNIQQMTATPNYPILVGGEVSFSITTDKTPIFARWNYGDGSATEIVSPTATVKHTFKTVGSYTVGVDVMSASGLIGHKEQYVDVLSADQDDDRDYLPDWWEYKYGLNPHSTWFDFSDGTTDSDGDGVDNATEFKGGTNPRDSADWPLVVSAITGDGQVKLVWNHAPDVPAIDHYNVCYATAVIDPKTVVDAATCQQVQGGTWIMGASNPRVVSGLENRKTYHFVVFGMDVSEQVVRTSNKVDATPTATTQTTACPKPVKSILFKESFDGTEIDRTKWDVDYTGGNAFIADGKLSATSDGTNRFPVVQTKTNPFPASGNFSFYCKANYTQIAQNGTGACVAVQKMIANGSASSTYDSGSTLQLWADSSLGGVSWWGGEWLGTAGGTQLFGNIVPQDTADHEYEACVIGSQVIGYRDGVKVGEGVLPSGWQYPTKIWIGNPVTGSAGYPWSTFDTDAVEVRQLEDGIDPTGWIQNPTTKHYYKALNNCGNWEQCETAAQALGAHLVVMEDQAENDWLASTFNVANMPHGYWIGYTDKEQEGAWKTVFGDVATYTNWIAGEPDNYRGWVSEGEQYAHIAGAWYPSNVGGWNDISLEGGLLWENPVKQAIIERTAAPNINVIANPFTVQATDEVGTAFTVPAGKTQCTFNATGTWKWDVPSAAVTADGIPSADYRFRIPTGNAFGLILQRENSAFEHVGSSRMVDVTGGETIRFLMNDAPNSGGNSGELSVSWSCQ